MWSQRALEFKALDPKAEAREMFSAGKVVFAGVNTDRSNVPWGVELTRWEECRFPTVPIEGTTDFHLGTAEFADFHAAALSFARRYNQELLRLMRSR